MGFATHFRTRSLVSLGVALGALALLLSWSFGTMSAQATTPHPGLTFTLAVEGNDGCDTSGGDAACDIDTGTQFTVDVVLESLPSDIPAYRGYDIAIEYTGVTSADDASMSSWPDCAYPATFFNPGLISMGCAVGVAPAPDSTYTGVIGTSTFTCDSSGTITLRHGFGNTGLTQALTSEGQHAEGEGTGETLNITCAAVPPAPTSTPAPAVVPTALPGTGTAGPDHGGSAGTGLWITIGVLLAAGAAGAGVFGRRFARVAR